MAKSDQANNGSSTINSVALPTINNVSMERIDILPLKKQLQAALTDKVDQYWDYVKKFLNGKLSKRELDYFVLDYLTESNIHLHNQFFKALIFNSFYAKTAPPILEPPKPVPKKKIISFSTSAAASISSPSETGTGATATATGTGAAKEKDAKSSLSKKEREKEREREREKKKDKSSSGDHEKSKKDKESTSSSKKRSTSSSSSKKLRSSTSSQPISTQKREKRTHPKYSLLYCPEIQALKDRMETIACESGLSGVSRQSVIYMMMALEQHIREILHNTIPVCKQNTNYDLPPNQQPPPFYLAYQYDIHSDPANEQSPSITSNRTPSTSQLTLKNNHNNNSTSQSISSDIEENENNETNENNNEINNNDDPMITTPISTTSVNNSNNNNTTNTNNNHSAIAVTASSSSATTTKKPLQNPNYFLSKNPLLSFSIPIYKIPENLFKSTTTTTENNDNDYYDEDSLMDIDNNNNDYGNKDMTLTTQDLYTTIETNPYLLGEDTLNMERLNIFRFK